MELFQQTWLRPIYDTPIPWVLALIVWLLPRAVLLHRWVAVMTQSAGTHLAEMLVRPDVVMHHPPSDAQAAGAVAVAEPEPVRRAARNLLFRLRDLPQAMAIGLLCYWAYLDLSTAYLLAPSGMSSGLVRLYNFMHFGRSVALSTEALLFFGSPILAIVIVVQCLRFR